MHRLIRPLVQRYIVVSQMVWDVVVRKERADPRKLVKIFNGVNLDSYQVPGAAEKAAAREKLGLAAGDVVIGIVGWLRPEKDHQLLLHALQQLRARGLPAKLVVVGTGPLLEPSKQWVIEQGLGDSIQFTGGQENVRPFLAALDIACLVPKANEGFSNSVLEKMSFGLPLVVTDIGGNREAVETGVNGFVIPPGALVPLVENLTKLCTDPALRSRMGAASRDRVERLFSLQHMIGEHERLYLSLGHGAGHA
jgi:glycosyltransferase involved in cell wall biosynthesis